MTKLLQFKQGLTNDKKGWIILIACIIVDINRSSLLYNFGVFIAELRRIYGRSMAELNWIGLLAQTIASLFTVLALVFIKRLGHKAYMVTALIGTISQSLACFLSSTVEVIPWLFLTYSFLYGVGAAMLLSSSTLITNVFYGPTHKYHVVANSLNHYGVPIATLCFGPFLIWLISISSWKFALRILGVILLASGTTCSLLFLLENSPEEDEEEKSNKDETRDGKNAVTVNSGWLDVCRRPDRFLWFSGLALTYATQLMPLYNLTHFMEENGYEKHQSSITLIVYSVFGLVGFVLSGIFGEKLKGNLVCPFIFAAFGCGVTFLLWPLICSTYIGILTISSFTGFFVSLNLAFHSPATIEVIDMDICKAWVTSCVACGIGALVGPFFLGAMYDYTQSYHGVFLIVGGLCILNSLVYAVIYIIRCSRQAQNIRYEQLT